VSSASELPAALTRLFELHARRAGYTDGADHADYLKSEAPRGLLRDLAREPEQAPALRVFQLVIGGQVVATRLGFLLGDELYLHFSGFDPQWGRYSVMTTVVAEVLKWALEGGLRCVNLSAGTDVSKTRWSPEVITTCDGTLVSPALRGRVAWRLWRELTTRSRSGLFARLLDKARRPD
jgi:CelD/BcsL family acetyltransferase involved in cellulose biosynthesis